MSKRRTKKDKLKVKHQFLIKNQAITYSSINPHAEDQSEANVKGEIKKTNININSNINHTKSVKFLVKDGEIQSVKTNLGKSLLISLLIIALEVVLYFTWNK
jgi:hypothetical protein